MVNQEHLANLKQGGDHWNAWRKDNPKVSPDLSSADLSGYDLRLADLHAANLIGATLVETQLCDANLASASLFDANLSSAALEGASFNNANMNYAKLCNASLVGAVFLNTRLLNADLCDSSLISAYISDSDLSGADLTDAMLIGTRLIDVNCSNSVLTGVDFARATLINVNLDHAQLRSAEFSRTLITDMTFTNAIDLDQCTHASPSYLSLQTLRNAPDLPLTFLRGCGLTDLEILSYQLANQSLDGDQITEIGYELIRLRSQAPIEYQSCFISFSSRDATFAEALYNRLQNGGVRCWFAPADMKMGVKIRDELHKSIRLHERLIIILSESSIASQWVEDEVNMALKKERQTDDLVLFPIRLDNAVFNTQRAWAETLCNRNIGDFSSWENGDSFDKSFNKLLSSLKNAAIPKD